MKERGLSFLAEFVPKVLDGSQTVTRRLGGLNEINENPDDWDMPVAGGGPDEGSWLFPSQGKDSIIIKCPHGVPGDRFYIKETWQICGWPEGSEPFSVRLRDGVKVVDCGPDEFPDGEATIERLWMQCGDDCDKAGLTVNGEGMYIWEDEISCPTRWRSGRFQPKWACRPQRWEIVSVRPESLQDITEEDSVWEGFYNRECFSEAWDSINAKRGYPWEKNPWVWRIEWNPEPVEA